MVSRRISGPDITRLASLAAAAMPLLLFVLIISIRIPPTISRLLSAYSFPLFLVVLLTYYADFRLPARYRWMAAASETMVLLALSLSFLWSSGYSDDKIIGGLLPFRDGFDYFNGADWIRSGHLIKTINEGAAWRPLYPGFLSSLLWLTGRNLQWALAIQVGLAGLCLGLTAMQASHRVGAPAAALLMTLLYFYIQPLVGTAYTETLGLAMGCLGFVLLWESASRQRQGLLAAGLVTLMIAISARAGAFFIFPALMLWAGWAWRGDGRFSFRAAGCSLAVVAASYLVVNTLYAHLVVEPGGYPFGNFAFTLYGQVNGGAGYHKAFEDLGVRNPAVILRAAEHFFIDHPLGFVVGAAKAYRDFFSPIWGVLSFGSDPADAAIWILGTMLLILGLYRTIRQRATVESSLLLAGFTGVFLSVPFLPPWDGGVRIYASSIPFVYVLVSIGVTVLLRAERADASGPTFIPASRALALGMGLMTVAVPVVILYLTRARSFMVPSCPAGQVAYAVMVSRGSYVDLVPSGVSACGRLPEVCLGQFEPYTASNDPSDTAVFAELAAGAGQSPIRVIEGNDMLAGRPHLFLGAAHYLTLRGSAWTTGCATEIQIKGRPSIYTIQSMMVAGPGQ